VGRRTDISSVLVIGSGPIVIGQACEFDYSGTQACRVLRDEGLRVILVNSNPATIMTDPEFADATYVEPITPEFVEKVIDKERPDALLATLGGQTALNTAVALDEHGVLEKYGVEIIGASIEAIQAGENRQSFKAVVEALPPELHATVARSTICHSLTDCRSVARSLGYPLVVRPSFTMGGAGSGMAYDDDDLLRFAGVGLAVSPTSEVLLEESIIGWKEYELEVMRDRADNVVVICSIENVDPMGVHTGDSITVAPAMTLTDREYQRLRDIAIGVIRRVGVDTGGCNIQFAVNPSDGRVVVIEMNPRVSRSSALASKATGFPIAKIAAKVAIGYTLDEIRNDITATTPASFEPSLDYVVVKAPRFAFEKFPAADPTLTTHMKSVGEAMAIGRNFTEALQKALRSLEDPHAVFSWHGTPGALPDLLEQVATPRWCHDRPDPPGHHDRPVVHRPAGAHQRGRDRGRRSWRAHLASAAPGQAAWFLRRPDCLFARHLGGRRKRSPTGARAQAGLQDRRHLCRRVRCPNAVPLLQLRRGDRGGCPHYACGHHLGKRAQPDRAGHRVRLFVCSRVDSHGSGRL
jgi:carbamoyl-phosphate synthase large subunit